MSAAALLEDRLCKEEVGIPGLTDKDKNNVRTPEYRKWPGVAYR
jgi:hypothetical protein